MINFEEIKEENCQPPPPTPLPPPPPRFKNTYPCTILPPPYLNFSDSPNPLGKVIEIYSPPPHPTLKRGGFKLCKPINSP